MHATEVAKAAGDDHVEVGEVRPRSDVARDDADEHSAEGARLVTDMEREDEGDRWVR